MDERVWLRHKETGHLWECPAGAVEDWTSAEMGWEVTDDRPAELNPVVAELLAFQAQPQEPTKAPAKSARKTEE